MEGNTQEILKQLKEYFSIENIIKYLSSHLFNAVLVILLIIFYGKIKKYTRMIIKRSLKKLFAENPGIATFLNSILGFFVDVVLIYLILYFLGINLSGIAAFFGAISLVLGFAFKDSLSNFFGGLIILLFKPFKVNDVIDYKSFVGTVKKIEIFYTTIVNFQNEEVIVPNGNLVVNEIRNINSNQHRRLDIQVGVGYGSNIQQVKDVIIKIINKRKDDLFYIEEVAPVVGLYEIGASSLNFDIRVFVRPNQYLMARYYLNEEIKTVFDALGIVLPFNIIDLQIDPAYNNIRTMAVDKFPKLEDDPNVGPILDIDDIYKTNGDSSNAN